MKLSKQLLTYVSNEKESNIIASRTQEDSNRQTSVKLGIPRRTVDRIVKKVETAAAVAGYVQNKAPRILTIDIETAPMVAYLWSMWQHGTNINAIESGVYMITWAAKWLDEDEPIWDSIHKNPDYEAGSEDDRRMLKGIWALLDEADFVVAHNGDGFDIKHLNTRFLLAGMQPPSPYKSIDTLKIAKRKFKFDSNKLDYLLQKMYGDHKLDAGGMSTWIGCLKGDIAAWDHMVKYNIGDVVKLERLYLDIRGWDHLHPSAATHGGVATTEQCTACGSEDVHETTKTVSTGTSVFPVWRCDDCGHTMRGRTSILSKAQKGHLLVNAR